MKRSRPARLQRSRVLIASLVLLAACHSDPYPADFYGATGPLVNAAETRLTYGTADQYGHSFQAYAPSWTAAGEILYTFSPRPFIPHESVRFYCLLRSCAMQTRDPYDTCIATLPATGGSATWQMCEERVFHTDSTDVFASGAVNESGQVLYIEATGDPELPFPLGLHAQLWVGGRDNPFPRQRSLALYSDDLGVDQSPPDAINWLTETTWTGDGRFLAIAGHLFPADSLRPRGLVRGAIGANGATVTVIPGTESDSIAHFGVVSGGSAVVFVDSTRVVRRLVISTGETSVVTTLPLTPAGRTIDIGCHPDVCLVLARDGQPAHWDLWRVDLTSGGPATIVRTFTHPLTAAKLSPVSGDVVALEGANLYLLQGVLP